MCKRVFTVSQLSLAIDWLFRCKGALTLNHRNKPYYSLWSNVKAHTFMDKERAITCIEHAVGIYTSRYGHNEEDFRIVITEPGLDELIEDF